jgi:hypothetical protein
MASIERQEYVKAFFKENGCTLLSEKYVNEHVPLKFLCLCGKEIEMPYKLFIQYKKCHECCGIKKSNRTSKLYGPVKTFYTEHGCTLLSDKFLGARVPMNFICSCGVEDEMAYRSFRNYKRCHDCYEMKRISDCYSYYCELFGNRGFTLLESQRAFGYKESLRYRCSCGNMSFMTVESVKDGSSCSDCAEKKKQLTMIKTYDVSHPSKSQEILEKTKQTNNERYGCDNPMQNKSIAKKSKQTSFDRYGCWTSQYPEFIAKRKETNIERYGDKSPFRNEIIKAKIRETVIKRYGGTGSTLSSPIIREKIVQTWMKKYGVPHPCPQSFYRKEFIMPSGEVRKVQGYENFCLTDLLPLYDEGDIFTKINTVPIVEYFFKDKKYNYYPDIYIRSANLLIEVKSWWTLKIEVEKCQAKFRAALETNYNFEVRVYDKRGKYHKLDIEKFVSKDFSVQSLVTKKSIEELFIQHMSEELPAQDLQILEEIDSDDDVDSSEDHDNIDSVEGALTDIIDILSNVLPKDDLDDIDYISSDVFDTADKIINDELIDDSSFDLKQGEPSSIDDSSCISSPTQEIIKPKKVVIVKKNKTTNPVPVKSPLLPQNNILEPRIQKTIKTKKQ